MSYNLLGQLSRYTYDPARHGDTEKLLPSHRRWSFAYLTALPTGILGRMFCKGKEFIQAKNSSAKGLDCSRRSFLQFLFGTMPNATTGQIDEFSPWSKGVSPKCKV